jgi:hypothetical protein
MSTSRSDRASHLLDITITELTKRVEGGEASASLLREVIALARAAGVDFAEGDKLMASAGRRHQESEFDLSILDDVDLDALGLN